MKLGEKESTWFPGDAVATAGRSLCRATRDMAEVEKLADRAAILLGGRIAAQDTPRKLTAVDPSV